MIRPGKIVCVGRNYAKHVAEMGNTLPTRPVLFLKPPSAVIREGEPIVLPPASIQVEHEGEIGIIIGRRLRWASEADALASIAGITCVNDVTARDLQRSDEQWTRAKGFDTFCPIGPRVVECPTPEGFADLEVICRVNGQVRQHGYGRQMIFKVPMLLSYISEVMTLEPGDLVATGTPDGVGPLVAGDVVEVEVSGVGVLRNPVVAETARRTA